MGSVNYANMPLEYQYLSQFHGFPNPVAGTPLGQKFGLTTQKNTYNNPRTAGAFTPPMQQPQPYMQQMASPQMVNQMGQMFGQMGQLGQMGGQMASMLRPQGGHQNQFMAGQFGWGQLNQHHQMGGQSNWGQTNQNPMSSLGQNSMGAIGMFGQNAQNSMAGQSVQVHQPSHYGTQYNSAMPVMASASSSQDSSFDSINN